MAIIPFPMDLSPQGPGASNGWELRSLSVRNPVSPLNGVATTLDRPGAHFALRLPYSNLVTSRRARVQTLAASLRGHANRTYVPVYGWTRRGSFPSTELITNTSTSNWVAGSEYTLSYTDGMLRMQRNAVTTSHDVVLQNITVTQYAPYVMRAILHAGRGAFTSVGPQFDGSSASVGTPSYRVVSIAPLIGGAFAVGILDNQSSGLLAGDYFEASFISASRCALVDNGPNLLLHSQGFDNAAWTKSACTISADQSPAPDGTATYDRLIENSSSAQHYVSQSVTVSSAAADYAFAVAVSGNGRSFCSLRIDEASTSLEQFFSLTAGGSVGATGTTGGNWANRRAFTVDLGNNWVLCVLIGRKTSAATSLVGYIMAATADGTNNYLGDGSSGLRLWGGTMAQSSVPTRLVLTTSAATSGTSQTGGALYLKGLPASTNGLLLQGDPAEIIIGTTSQLVRTRGSLNSDAAGLGYWQFEPPLRVSPSDNAAVIVTNPLCKMMSDDNVARWSDRLGGFSDMELALVEDTYPS